MAIDQTDAEKLRVGALGRSVDDPLDPATLPTTWTTTGPAANRNTLNTTERVVNRAVNALSGDVNNIDQATQAFDERFNRVIGEDGAADQAAFNAIGSNLIQAVHGLVTGGAGAAMPEPTDDGKLYGRVRQSGNPVGAWQEITGGGGGPAGTFLPTAGGTVTGNLSVDGSLFVSGHGNLIVHRELQVSNINTYGNTLHVSGGGLYVYGDVNAYTISGSTYEGHYGHINAPQDAYFAGSTARFEGPYSRNYAGKWYYYPPRAEFQGSVFLSGNYWGNIPGGLHLSNRNSLRVSGGGSIYMSGDGALYVYQMNTLGNQLTISGGALQVWGSIRGSQITGSNFAGAYGYLNCYDDAYFAGSSVYFESERNYFWSGRWWTIPPRASFQGSIYLSGGYGGGIHMSNYNSLNISGGGHLYISGGGSLRVWGSIRGSQVSADYVQAGSIRAYYSNIGGSNVYASEPGNFYLQNYYAGSAPFKIYATNGMYEAQAVEIYAGGHFMGAGAPGDGIRMNGNLVITNGAARKPGGGAWEAISDARTKTDVKPYQHGLKELLQLDPISFRYNGRGRVRETGKQFVGLAAEEAEKVMPEIVGKVRGRLEYDDEEDTDIRTVDPSALTYATLNALKELHGLLQNVEARLTALEDKK